MQMSLKIVLLLVLAHFGAIKGDIEEGNDKLIGGAPALQGRFQEVVGLEVWINNKRHWCTGSVLSDTTVLTAGHCLINVTSIKVYVNCPELKTCKNFRSATGRIHPGMSDIHNFTVNDLGVVETTTSLGAGRFVTLGSPAHFYRSCTVVGYGKTKKEKEPNRPRKIMWLVVRKILHCSVFYPRDKRLTNMLCSVAQKGKMMYKGDSGGPLFCGRHQVGVSSQIIYRYNLGQNRTESIMVWEVPANYSQWIFAMAPASANHLSSLPTLAFLLLQLIICTNNMA